mgnify:CR=1 FL=1
MMRRFEFWLKTPGLWNEIRSSKEMGKALNDLNAFDSAETRQDYWRNVDPERNDPATTAKLVEASKALDEVMLELDVLNKEYGPVQSLSCSRFKTGLADFEPVDREPRWGPLESTGNFVPMPTECIAAMEAVGS